MNNRVSNCRLYLFCFGLILLAGCGPEDSLDWSADGSVGLLRTDGKLYVVDGHTGALSPVPANEVSPWPDISRDGKRIVYAEQVKHATLAEGLKSLPAEHAKMIAEDTRALRDKIISGTLIIADFNATTGGQFGASGEPVLGYAEPYRQWVVRSLCQDADGQLARKLGDKLLQQGKTAELTSFALIVAPVPDLENGKILTTSVLDIARPRFSPDSRYVAYLLGGPTTGQQRTYLFVAASRERQTGVYVASNVSLGFDWRQDSEALAYLQQEAETTMLGTIREQRVCDPNGKLLEEVSDDPTKPLAAHHIAGESKQLAGTLFQPLTMIEYGVEGRLFFSSVSAKLPTADVEEPDYSLFCYDFVTGAVAEVLPSKIRNELSAEMIVCFSLSPDRRKVLLPMEKGRLAIYELGTKSPIVPIKENEEFGEDLPKMLPTWKGNDRISCQVSEKSHFLNDEQQKRGRKEIVVLDAAGNLKSLLSSGWPDEALPGKSND